MLKTQLKVEPPKKREKKPLDLTPILTKLGENQSSLENLAKSTTSILTTLNNTLIEVKNVKGNEIFTKLAEINKTLLDLVSSQRELNESIKGDNEKFIAKIIELLSKDNGSKEYIQILTNIQKQMLITNNLLTKPEEKIKEETPKEWIFTVSRNDDGINKVIAKAK